MRFAVRTFRKRYRRNRSSAMRNVNYTVVCTDIEVFLVARKLTGTQRHHNDRGISPTKTFQLVKEPGDAASSVFFEENTALSN